MRLARWGGAALSLAIPAIATWLGIGGVDWGPGDFLAFAALLATAVGAFELAARSGTDPSYRAGAAVALGTAFLLAWANLAVGVAGPDGDPANRLAWIVLAVCGAGAALARLRAAGLARALAATAIAQGALASFVLLAGRPRAAAALAAFVAAWLLAAWLFRRAARR